MSGASSCLLTTILSVLVLALSGPRVFLFAIFTILKPKEKKTENCSSAMAMPQWLPLCSVAE